MEPLSDSDIRKAVDLIFTQYDSEKAGKLNIKNMSELVGDVLCTAGDNRKITEDDLNLVLRHMNAVGKAMINKDEMFLALKSLGSLPAVH